uniref:Uncharacterized protein n=1 Tax=Anguilla anguilla TaxID=7936 RepID=A0A0E9V3V7_ANGAN
MLSFPSVLEFPLITVECIDHLENCNVSFTKTLECGVFFCLCL